VKTQWLQDQSEINGDNLNNIRRENGRDFRNKKRERIVRKRTLETCIEEYMTSRGAIDPDVT
jgi:hypothetical protein